MDENNNQEVQVPDFSNEEMKMPESVAANPAPQEKSSVINGPLLIVLALMLVLILGGMYYWFGSLNSPEPVTPTTVTPVERPTAEENNEPESTTAETQVQQLETVSTSDEIAAIEADLEATDLEALDAELEAIDAELEAALNEL